MDQDALTERLQDLEARYCFQEDTVQQLDQAVQELSELVLTLQREVVELREQLAQSPGSVNGLQDEVPPHY